MWGKIEEGEMEDDRGIKLEVRRGYCMEPGKDGHVELLEGGYWDFGFCTGVGGSGGVGASVRSDGAEGVVVLTVLVVVVATVVVRDYWWKLIVCGSGI